MEQLQRQQQARLEMEREEQRLREAHVMYVQQVAARQAILAAGRASGGPFPGKAAECRQGVGESARPCGEGARDSEGEDEEDEEAMEEEEEEGCEGDAASGGAALEYLREQSLALQKATSRLPAHPCPPYLAPGPQCAASPPVRVKEESRSPAGPPSDASPNGQADWSCDEQLKQVRDDSCVGGGLCVMSVPTSPGNREAVTVPSAALRHTSSPRGGGSCGCGSGWGAYLRRGTGPVGLNLLGGLPFWLLQLSVLWQTASPPPPPTPRKHGGLTFPPQLAYSWDTLCLGSPLIAGILAWPMAR